MDAIELRNPQALTIPDIQQLLRRAVESGVLLAPSGFDSVAPDIFSFVTDPQRFMVLGAEKGRFRAALLGFFPGDNLFPYPTIVLFYNEGSRALSRLVRERTMDILLSAGYTRMLAVNTSGYPDDVWQRGLATEGSKSDKIGSLILFEVE